MEDEKKEKQRTIQQNKALHLYFRFIAEALNEAGLDMRKFLKQEIDIPWSDKTVKEFLWRPVMKAQLLKESTTEMSTTDIDKVLETLNRYFTQKGLEHIPFPSLEELMNNPEL